MSIVSEALRLQLQLGWEHFILGRICLPFTQHLNSSYITRQIQRNGQSATAQIIQWMWITLIRSAWNDRNTYVHRHHGMDKSKQLHEDTKVEAAELFNTIDIEQLCCTDRHLMEVDYDELIKRPQYQLDAWIHSVEAAIKVASTSSTIIIDATQ